jgi:hypothetical protein
MKFSDAVSLVGSRVESWRGNQMVLFLTPPHRTIRSVFPSTAFQSSSSRGFRFRLASGIASTGVPEPFGVHSVTAISIPLLFEKHDEGIASSLGVITDNSISCYDGYESG